MKYLKIENNKAYFIQEMENDVPRWVLVDQLTKEGIFFLLNKATTGDFEMDEFREDILQNKAHQIIYKSLFEKFSDLVANKTRFKDESERLYKAAIEKYSAG